MGHEVGIASGSAVARRAVARTSLRTPADPLDPLVEEVVRALARRIARMYAEVESSGAKHD